MKKINIDKKEEVTTSELRIELKFEKHPFREEKYKNYYGENRKIILLPLITHDFVAHTDDGLAKQLNAFSAALNGPTGPTELATKYGYSTAKLLSIKNDAAYFDYFNTKHGAGVKYKEQWTEKGNEIKNGKGTSISAFPVGTDVSSPPTAVLPGVISRFRENARFAKGQTSIYTETDGIAMNIEVVNSQFNPSEGQPDLKVSISDGGHPLIGYTKDKYVGANIYVDRGDGSGSVFLFTCNDPSCSDMTPLPKPGMSAVWTYTAYYIFGGEQVGTISKKTTITVLGV